MTETTERPTFTYKSALIHVTEILTAAGLTLTKTEYQRGAKAPTVTPGYRLATDEEHKQVVQVTYNFGPGVRTTKTATKNLLNEAYQALAIQASIEGMGWNSDTSILLVRVDSYTANTVLADAEHRVYVYQEGIRRDTAILTTTLEEIASRVERLAQDTRRNAERLRAEPTGHNARMVVEGVQNDFMWGMANLQLPHLVSSLEDLWREEQHLAKATETLERLTAE